MTLEQALARHKRLAIAVSGGVDSMTLAHAAHAVRGLEVEILHAVSPAVDRASTDRVIKSAQEFHWRLLLIEPGEFADPDYLKNPVNRCFFCKSNLYDRISGLTDAPIASGTNTDDLGDYRPGLLAAKARNVVHPFVLAGMAKSDVRALATKLGLPDIASLPAQPCLASRIETGIAIDARDLAFVESTEKALRDLTGSGTLRCRIVKGGVRIELGTDNDADEAVRADILAQATDICERAGRRLLSLSEYRQGSAFLHG